MAAHSAWRRFRDLLKERTKTTARTTFDRLDAHPLTGWVRALSFEFETTKGYRRTRMKMVRPEGLELSTFWFVAEQDRNLSACSGVAYERTGTTLPCAMIPR